MLFFFSIFTACQEKEELSPSLKYNNLEHSIDEYLQCLGFDTKDAFDCDNHILIEKDIFLQKDFLLTSMHKGKNEAWAIDGGAVVDISEVQYITYAIHSNVTNMYEGSAWNKAIHKAIKRWNNLPNTSINLIKIKNYAKADLKFAGEDPYESPDILEDPNFSDNCTLHPFFLNCSMGGIALAAMPVSGQIGEWIAIFNCPQYFTSIEEYTNTITHEIGHALGFRHATLGCENNEEEDYFFECTFIAGANHLFQTPYCDEQSFMGSGNINNSFSVADENGIRMLYPAECCPPQITAIIESTIPNDPLYRYWELDIINDMPWYEFQLQLRDSNNDTILKTTDWFLGDATSIGIDWNTLGNYTISVKARNYKGDLEIFSDFVNVSIP